MSKNSSHIPDIRQLPLIAGLLSSISLLMSIPPLADSWETHNFQSISDGSQHSPQILALLIIGLISQVIGGVCLLLRFLGKRIKLTTWLTIGFYLIDFATSLATSIVFLMFYKFKKNSLYSGEFYINLFSGGISLMISLVLIIDYIKTRGLKRRSTGLNGSQKILIYLTLAVTLWVIFGALTFHLCEGWPFARGVYVVLVTSSTIGFGDYFPETIAGRALLMVYSGVGIILIGLLIAYFNSVLLESFEQEFYKNLDKLGELSMEGLQSLMDQYYRKEKVKLDDKLLNRENTTVSFDKSVHDHENDLEKAKIKQYLRHLKFSSIFLLLFWLLGAALFSYLEGWDYFTAIYFCYVSFTTIGYGDVTVESFLGLVIFCIYIITGLVTMTYFISVTSELFSYLINSNSDRFRRIKKRKQIMLQNKRLKKLVTSIGDPFSHLELLDILDLDTGNDEIDIIKKLVAMTEFYHKEVGSICRGLIAESRIKKEDEEDEIKDILMDKMSKYDELYEQILELCRMRLVKEEIEESTVFELEIEGEYS